MVQVADEYGVPAHTCLAGSGVPATALSDDGTRVHAAQELIVAHNLVRATGDPPGLGFEVGGRFRLRMYGVWGFALLTSPTLREAAAVGVRYLELTYATAGIQLHSDRDEARLIVDEESVPRPVRRFVVGRELAAIRTSLDTLLGHPFAPVHLEVRFPRPATTELSQAVTGVPITFSAAHNAIVATADLLDRPLPQADPDTRQACERECRALLARRTSGETSSHVRDLLMGRHDELPDMSEVAESLHVSTRTLHRRLAQEGTSYRRLLDEVRHVLAIELLTTAGLAVDQVAVRLGYAGATASIRAFRRWTGSTPSTSLTT